MNILSTLNPDQFVYTPYVHHPHFNHKSKSSIIYNHKSHHISKALLNSQIDFLEPYQVFCIQNRPDIQKTNPSLSSSDITSLLGKIWRSMDANQRMPFIEMALQYNNSQKKGDILTNMSSSCPIFSKNSNPLQKDPASEKTLFSEPNSLLHKTVTSQDIPSTLSKISFSNDPIVKPHTQSYTSLNAENAEYVSKQPEISSEDIYSNNFGLLIPNIALIKRNGLQVDIDEINQIYDKNHRNFK